MTTIHTSPGAPFSIYEDQSAITPSEYDADSSFNSETGSLPAADDPIDSIEIHSPAFSPSPSSRRVSALTAASLISDLPSELSITSKSSPHTRGYTPMKERPPFRNPSSVRALQMASPPPFEPFSSPRAAHSKPPYKMSTPSRRSETPSHNSSHRSQSLQQRSPHPMPTPSRQLQQQFPLVLLHVTLLPLTLVYSPSTMEAVLPLWLAQNFRLLEERLQDAVLMQRGLLIRHPRDEYDLLEERLLESLELKTPRVLKCGHFIGDGSDASDNNSDGEGSGEDDEEDRGSRMSGGTVTADEDEAACRDLVATTEDDASVCTDCHRPIKKPGLGAGSGTKKWDIKIYAANGLMRAGAWAAAWSEMERVDVEISPWIPEEVRKALEKRREEEEREEEIERKKAQEEAEEKRTVEE
ncbi:uncharacterized protein K441DRAFT_663428, partial [Cenococcum geophilum 1.58]|uniref:uncharacterized protein n=1 Tax=Cenococcum geophilum 1.58 TaxID=794803 RepID=UPI00358F2B46